MESITQDKIDELLRFLPIFQQPGRKWIEWQGGETGADGVITMPYPDYPKEVDDFFRLAAQSPWCDYGYNPAQASRMVDDDAFIQAASLAEIKTMLTFCVRGEHFCDGHWGYLLESGKLVKILERLKTLKAEAAK